MGQSSIVVMLVLTAINYIGLWYIASTPECRTKQIALIVIGASALNFGVYNELNYDRHTSGFSNNYYYQKSLVEGAENTESCFEYRIDYPGQIANYSLFKNMPSVNYYNSLQNPGSSRFAQAVGIGDNLTDTIMLTPTVGGEYTDALLSVKYYYDYDGDSVVPTGFRYLKVENGVDIYENENFIPMGFSYDSYCLEEQLANMQPEDRAEMMLHTMVIQKADEEMVSNYLPLETNLTVASDLVDLASERRETVCSNFSGTSDGFTAEIDLEQDNIVFFSIPNDIGWKITVNGEPASVVDVNYGLLGICCEAGNNTISATYHTQGWTLGLVCSLTCLAAWLLLEIFSKRIRTKGVQ